MSDFHPSRTFSARKLPLKADWLQTTQEQTFALASPRVGSAPIIGHSIAELSS
jgi:hypothetical protein